MSYKIIKINRGDSFSYKINVTADKAGNSPYLLSSEDAVYFAILYPHQKFEDAVLLRGYTKEDQDGETGEIIVQLSPNDTRCLCPGIYYYTVKLQRGGTLGVVDDLDEPLEIRTLVERTKFIINE